jgi:phage shock protein C
MRENWMTIFCQRCGTGLAASANFCSSCGAEVPAVDPLRGWPPFRTPPFRTLTRPRFGRQIGGVCIALAQANGWDATAIRIIAVLGFLCTSGLLGVAYLALWVGIPEETPPAPGAYPPTI